MTVVVDASVACKWFVEETGSEAADRLLASDLGLVAPELIVPEVCSALWRKSGSGEIDDAQAAAAVDDLLGFFDELVPAAGLAPRALAIARALAHPVYDCFYVALAERIGAPVITAEGALVRRLSGTDWSRFVVDLKNADAAIVRG